MHIQCLRKADSVDEMFGCMDIHTALFASLHHFKNISIIDATSIQFTEEIITQIFSLSLLTELHLESCRTDPSIVAPDICPGNKPVEFSYDEVQSHGEPGRREIGPTGYPWWLRLLSKENTKSLSLIQPHNTAVLLRFLAEGFDMKKLTFLNVSPSSNPALFVGAIAQCPLLECLVLTSPDWKDEETTQICSGLQERGALSRLNHYDGPFEIGYALLRISPIHEMIINLMSEEDAHQLLQGFRTYKRDPTYLELDISSVGLEFMKQVLAFPTLEWLEVTTDTYIESDSHHGTYSIDQVWLDLQSVTLPESLEYYEINVRELGVVQFDA
ncbi:hypothetical protein NLI96_g3852 [Meripilus lineatus]|uniref:Uncharacterized protein n=1 Tax=Meripilus lineatus TaxID=2056292 RepID=A0AAD5YFB3_9APHY|nr:hypothetical protein NLI96_g3852 [Physisporinus lineatus]